MVAKKQNSNWNITEDMGRAGGIFLIPILQQNNTNVLHLQVRKRHKADSP
jgi:hypothetical protein